MRWPGWKLVHVQASRIFEYSSRIMVAVRASYSASVNVIMPPAHSYQANPLVQGACPYDPWNGRGKQNTPGGA